MSLPDTKQRILDAAEHLFAVCGYHNTSLRSITAAAAVNLAAVNYHFGSKNALLNAVFERRLLPLNALRRQRLEAVCDAAQRERRPPDVATALRAFIEPSLRFRDSGGNRDFVTLVGRAISEPDAELSRSFVHHIEPILNLLFETLRQALPELSRETLFWRLQFALGALSHTMRMSQWESFLPEGIDGNVETADIIEALVAFVAAGMEQSP